MKTKKMVLAAVFAAAVFAALVLNAASCGSVPPEQASVQVDAPESGSQVAEVPDEQTPETENIPEDVRKAIGRLPENSIAGVGTSGIRNTRQARRAARLHAEADICLQLDGIVMTMVANAAAIPNDDGDFALSLRENAETAFSEFRLAGSRITYEKRDDEGKYWMVVELPGTNAVPALATAARNVFPGDSQLRGIMDDRDGIDAAIAANNRNRSGEMRND